MGDQLALGFLAVVVAEAVHAHGGDLALADRLAGDALEAGAHPARRRDDREGHVEHRLERVDGHALVRLVVASVPLATFSTEARPLNALASLPPPVVM